MNQFFKHIFTGKDNQTYDIGRVLWAIGVIAFICFAGYEAIQKGIFDAMGYGTGFGAVLAGGGVGIGTKIKGEPD